MSVPRVAKTRPEAEKQWMARLVELFHVAGWKVYHPYRSDRSAPGYPDLTCAHPKHGVVFIECKTETGRCTPEQLAWLRTLVDGGSRAHVMRPSDWDRAVALAQGKPVTHVDI